jgi:hypothetical protein
MSKLDYTNWRGIRSIRKVQPVDIKFTSNEWHPEEQWLLIAFDLEDAYIEKGFAIKNIHSWKPLGET